MADALSINFDDATLQAGLDALAAQAKTLARPAAQAGAQVFYDEVNRNVAGIGRKTGNLAASIYQAFSEDNSSDVRATYHISWNARKAPHGHLVEYGHMMTRKAYIGSDGNWYTSDVLLQTPVQVGARPFIRPAFAAAQRALEAARDRYVQDMRESGVVR